LNPVVYCSRYMGTYDFTKSTTKAIQVTATVVNE